MKSETHQLAAWEYRVVERAVSLARESMSLLPHEMRASDVYAACLIASAIMEASIDN